MSNEFQHDVRESFLLTFEDVHSYVRIWKCYACQELFDFPMYLYNHIYYEHTYGKFKCGRTECSFAEQTRNKVFRHFHSCSSKKSRR
ncbi:hypothetical protein TYRP_021968 [Tyrophagus putrescentiae]|nr:hypothetical protein TYRP_021968 [Tyrophagus putrescentiae]